MLALKRDLCRVSAGLHSRFISGSSICKSELDSDYDPGKHTPSDACIHCLITVIVSRTRLVEVMMVLLKDKYLRVGVGLAASWLFVAFSFFLSEQGAIDWFSRSGAVLCLMAASANFALVKVHQRDLAHIFKDQEHSRREKAEEILNPPASYRSLSWLSYFTGIVGTAIWGYGDLMF